MPPTDYTALPRTSIGSEGNSEPVPIQDTPATPPECPPDYEPSPDFQEMEIEEQEIPTNSTLRSKANRFASDFNRRVVQPINQVLDPVYQLYCYINAQFEFYVAKMGNPLIVKRILFIGFITIVLYIVSLSGITTQSILAQSDFIDFSTFEEFIETSIDVGRIEETIQYMSSMPRLSGTAGDFAIAKYFDQTLRSGSLLANPNIVFRSYHNYPLNPQVSLFENEASIHTCNLRETLNENNEEEEDYFTLAFNPGSKPGNVKGKFIYANYGEVKDYKLLADQNHEVNNKIVIIKYGGFLPAYTKLRYAQERGAIGVLFISDTSQQDIYTMDSIQREPVAFGDILPGNIIHPGPFVTIEESNPHDVGRLFDESPVAPTIPSLPISWNDFKVIMEKVKGKGSHFQDWDFNLFDKQIEIWFGDDTYEVNLNNDLTVRPNKESWNIMGKLAGREQDTYAIVIAASRDSLCHGAMESSGSAILLELINVFSEMSQSLRWKPLRSIFFVSYSGSKFNMAGSTYFPIKQADFFRRDVYSVIDLDDIIQGDHIQVDGDPIFHSILKDSVHRAMEKYGNSTHVEYDDNTSMTYNDHPYDNSLATSDHHGISRISLKLVKSKDSYHTPQYYKNSCLDTFQNFKNSRIDPDLSKHAFMTKLVANVIIKLVETPILPYDIDYALESWVSNFKHVVDFINHKKVDHDASDELKNINHDNVDRLFNQMQIISNQHRGFVVTWNDITANAKSPEPNLLAVNRWDWNSKLLLYLKVMLSVNGIYDNPWKYNLFYGRELNPGTVTDNELHNSFPGIWNAINKNDWVAVQEQINLLSDMLQQGLDLFQY